jgi:thiol-disulfide isomerase/thioredoxin
VTLDRTRLLYVPLALIAVLIVLAFLVPGFRAPQSQLARLTQEEPRPAPDVVLTDFAGKAHQLSEFRGRFILLNLWATWCAPCVREVPALARLSIVMPRNRFLVVAVALPPGSTKETHAFLVAHEASALPTSFDSQTSSRDVVQPYGLPLTVLIDPHGLEIARAQGSVEWDAPETIAYLKTLSGIR